MKQEWYVQIGERVYGPHTAKKLRQGAAEGRLHPDTPVRRGETGPWMPARRLQGLFQEAEPGPPAVGDEHDQSPRPSALALSALLVVVLAVGFVSAKLAAFISGMG